MKKIVISLGGSVIVPDEVDYKYLKKFSKIIKKFSRKNKIVIITGGGNTARNYISSVKKITNDDYLLSVVGIAATRLNARLVSGIFNLKEKIPETVEEVKKEIKKRNLVICGSLGMQKNMTSDGNAAEIAEIINADYLLNITNVIGLYDRHPKLKGARFIPVIGFKDFSKIVERIKFSAGQHFVLDQSAAKIILKSKIKTIITSSDLRNIKNVLKDKNFIGTIIS